MWARSLRIIAAIAIVASLPILGSHLRPELSQRFGLAVNSSEQSKARDQRWLQDLQVSPLSPSPFIEAMKAELDPVKQRSLLKEALSRDPRNLDLRHAALSMEATQGDWESFEKEIKTLISVNRDGTSEYLDILTRLVEHPENRQPILELVGKNRQWGQYLLNHTDITKAPPDFFLKLAQETGGDKDSYINRLARTNVEQAFLVWMSGQSHTTDLQFSGWPHNQKFQRTENNALFDWRLRAGADYLSPEGLGIVYQARETPIFAQQTMLLAPDRYRLSVEADGTIKPVGGGLEIVLSCQKKRKTIFARLEINSLNPEVNGDFTTDFEIPEGACVAQTLAVQGKPGEFPVWARAKLRKISITPVGGLIRK